jgi:hypothetical protein
MLWAVDPNEEEGIDVMHALPKLQLPDLRRLSLVGVMLRHSDLGWVPDVLKLFPSLDVMEGEVLNSREPRSPSLDPELNEYGAYEQRVSVDDPNLVTYKNFKRIGSVFRSFKQPWKTLGG